MFRVKICGVTKRADAEVAVQAGADAIGLNFCSKSPRLVTPEQAREIAASLPRGVLKVGVFAGATVDEIRRVSASVPLDLVQVHGDEPPEFLRALRPLPVMRALAAEGDLAAIDEYLAACHRARAVPRMLLVDARHNGQFGGTGKTLDWSLLRQHRQRLRGLPLVLAGGLTPDNVAEAIRQVRPWAVDVASGVESAPGTKSPELVRAFVSAAKLAFAERAGRG